MPGPRLRWAGETVQALRLEQCAHRVRLAHPDRKAFREHPTHDRQELLERRRSVVSAIRLGPIPICGSIPASVTILIPQGGGDASGSISACEDESEYDTPDASA